MKLRLKLIILKLLSFLPRPLPVGMTAFQMWSDRIILQSGAFADADSMRFALASQIMHLGATRSSVPDRYFIQSLRKVAANQVAGQVFQDIKTKQIEAAKAAKQEATRNETASNEQK